MTLDYFSPEWRAWSEMIHGDIAVGDIYKDDKYVYIVWRLEPPETIPPENLFDLGMVSLCFKDKSPKVDFFGPGSNNRDPWDNYVSMPLIELLNHDTIKKVKKEGVPGR